MKADSPVGKVSRRWKNIFQFFQSLELFFAFFPTIGKIFSRFSNHWKLFSRFFQPLEKIFSDFPGGKSSGTAFLAVLSCPEERFSMWV